MVVHIQRESGCTGREDRERQERDVVRAVHAVASSRGEKVAKRLTNPKLR